MPESMLPSQRREPAPWTTQDFGVLVCSSEPAVAAQLRAALDAQGMKVQEIDKLSELTDALQRLPAATGVVELAAGGLEQTAGMLWTVMRRFPAARMIVVAQRGMEPYECLVRELGAIHFVLAPRDLGPVCEMIRRRHAELPPPPSDDTLDAIWSRLPWPEWATRVRRQSLPQMESKDT